MRTGVFVGLVLAIFTSGLFGGSTLAPASSFKVSYLGGVRCESQVSGGVICKIPNRPVSVGLTVHNAFVWRFGKLQYVRGNR